MHAPIVAQRTKAIRALGSLITVDPEVLLEVRKLCLSQYLVKLKYNFFSLIERNQNVITG